MINGDFLTANFLDPDQLPSARILTVRDKKVPLRLTTELSRARAYENASDRAHTLLLELWATSNLLRLSQIAWSPTLKTHAEDLATRKQKLESQLNALRFNDRIWESQLDEGAKSISRYLPTDGKR